MYTPLAVPACPNQIFTQRCTMTSIYAAKFGLSFDHMPDHGISPQPWLTKPVSKTVSRLKSQTKKRFTLDGRLISIRMQYLALYFLFRHNCLASEALALVLATSIVGFTTICLLWAESESNKTRIMEKMRMKGIGKLNLK